jgi:hypothetical protein
MTKRKTRTAATNNGLVQCGVKCFVSAFVVKQTFVLRINSSAKNTALHQAAAPLLVMGLSDIERKIRFGLVGLFHRPASTQKLNRIEIIHVFQRPDHHIA